MANRTIVEPEYAEPVTPVASPDAPAATASASATEPSHDPLAELLATLRQLQHGASDYFYARAHQSRAKVRNTLLGILLSVAAYMLLGTVAIAGVALTLAGLVQAVSVGLGGRTWAGLLIVGLAAITGSIAVAVVSVRGRRAAWLRRAKEKYQARQANRGDVANA